MASGEVVFYGDRFQIERRSWQSADGQSHSRMTIQHPGAVGIVPVTDEGRICLIRNYRVAVDDTLWEIPAGTLEPGEDPRLAAARELTEETGYTAGYLEPLATLWMSPGILAERMHLFVAQNLTAGEQDLDVGEVIEPQVVTLAEGFRMIERGIIQDAKTVAALLLYARQEAKSASD